jgi:hypothetical protein
MRGKTGWHGSRTVDDGETVVGQQGAPGQWRELMALVMQNATTAANGRETTRRRALCNIWTTLRQENRNFRCKGDENGKWASIAGGAIASTSPSKFARLFRLPD